MRRESLNYAPPPWLIERVRLYILRTRWHSDLMAQMETHAEARLQAYGFPQERVHYLTVAGAFELPHLCGAIVRRYTWQSGFRQLVRIAGPTHIQSNVKLPPFFQGNFDSKLDSQFELVSPGEIKYPQPYEPGTSDDLPAIIAMGCILKGETEHNRFLAQAVFHSLSELNRDSGIPIILGILTPSTLKQAQERVYQAGDWVAAAFLSWEARLLIP
jgi:6,7-dimethyl-8-ribityllumazine synthase